MCENSRVEISWIAIWFLIKSLIDFKWIDKINDVPLEKPNFIASTSSEFPISSQTINSGESVLTANSIPLAFLYEDIISVLIPISKPEESSFLSSITLIFLYFPAYPLDKRRVISLNIVVLPLEGGPAIITLGVEFAKRIFKIFFEQSTTLWDILMLRLLIFLTLEIKLFL